LLLSLICSAVNEIIEAWLKKRASYLEQGIRELLDDPSGNGLARKLYSHPLIKGLFRGPYIPSQIKKSGGYASRSDLPSYIPARNFALALMDVVLPAQTGTPSGAAAAIRLPADPNVTVELNSPINHKLPGDKDNPLTPLRNA